MRADIARVQPQIVHELRQRPAIFVCPGMIARQRLDRAATKRPADRPVTYRPQWSRVREWPMRLATIRPHRPSPHRVAIAASPGAGRGPRSFNSSFRNAASHAPRPSSRRHQRVRQQGHQRHWGRPIGHHLRRQQQQPPRRGLRQRQTRTVVRRDIPAAQMMRDPRGQPAIGRNQRDPFFGRRERTRESGSRSPALHLRGWPFPATRRLPNAVFQAAVRPSPCSLRGAGTDWKSHDCVRADRRPRPADAIVALRRAPRPCGSAAASDDIADG